MAMKPIYFRFQQVPFLLLLLLNFILVSSAAALFSPHSNSSTNLEPFYQDSQALLAFKSKADLTSSLHFHNKSFNYLCRWQGVTCMHGRIFRLVLQNLDLRGTFPPDSLTRLDQLRVLSLQNNSLTGPLPDFSNLTNLKSLFLDHNSFSGHFPPSISALHRIRTIDLSHNNFTGPLPVSLGNLPKLYYLKLEYNSFNGSIPPLNQTSLQIFNVSHNNLSGAIPVTPTLLRSLPSSYSGNLGLCGAIIHRECHPGSPFFNNTAPASESASASPSKPHGQMGQVNGVNLVRPAGPSKHKRVGVIFGFLSGVLVLMGSIFCFFMAVKSKRREGKLSDQQQGAVDNDTSANENADVLRMIEENNELEEKVKQKVQGMKAGKSGSLVFCAGEPQVYTMDQLMRGSAELLGRGSLGTTYKAVLENRLIVTVKRLDAAKTSGADAEVYERHMESVGGLRHPNLVPLRAYFQAHEERLLIYDYQPNGSLHSLIHGSKSSRAKPLHWTSCLKIAEDVAQGLSYIHQAWRLIHGNLKSSNVLLGPDFEACLTDYCLSVLATSSNEDDANSAACKAPEIRETNRQATSKSDVYAFGVLLLEVLTGKPPSEHPYLIPDELLKWVRSAREVDAACGEDNNLVMLVEVAASCSTISPEQRPTMWQVLKMLQEIKDSVLDGAQDSELDPGTGMA